MTTINNYEFTEELKGKLQDEGLLRYSKKRYKFSVKTNELKDAKKNIKIWLAPKILIVCFKRFNKHTK